VPLHESVPHSSQPHRDEWDRPTDQTPQPPNLHAADTPRSTPHRYLHSPPAKPSSAKPHPHSACADRPPQTGARQDTNKTVPSHPFPGAPSQSAFRLRWGSHPSASDLEPPKSPRRSPHASSADYSSPPSAPPTPRPPKNVPFRILIHKRCTPHPTRTR